MRTAINSLRRYEKELPDACEICRVSADDLIQLPLTEAKHCGHCGVVNKGVNKGANKGVNKGVNKGTVGIVNKGAAIKAEVGDGPKATCQHCGFGLKQHVDYSMLTDAMMWSYVGAVVDFVHRDDFVRLLQVGRGERSGWEGWGTW